MPRARDPNRDKAFEIFKEHDGDITNRKIAEILDCPEKTISAWKSRDKWNAVLQTNECSTTNKNKAKKRLKKEATESVEVPLNEDGELTDKQWLFCMYYIRSLNATSAYKKVYECSYQTAMTNGSRLLSNAKVKEIVAELKRQRLENLGLDKYDVLEKYKAIAFADITDYADFGTVEEVAKDEIGKPLLDYKGEEMTYQRTFVNLRNADEVDGTLVTEVKKGKDGVSVKLADKMKALDFLAKYTDLLDEKELQQLKTEKERIAINKLSGDNSGSQESEIAKMLRKMAGDD